MSSAVGFLKVRLLRVKASQRGLRVGGDIDTRATFEGSFNPA